MFDFHIHTTMSFDAEAMPEEVVSMAERKGLKEICFTDHYDQNSDPAGQHFLFDVSDYRAAYDALSSDTVKIVCTDELAGTDRLTYGDISTDAYQWVNVNRGHLRDTQGDILQYKSGNLDDTHSVLPLHNWCVLFDKTIDELEYFENIPTVIPGDANGDDKVNNRDLGLLQQYLNEWDVTITVAAADLNGDGKVNNRDLGLLQQLLNS